MTRYPFASSNYPRDTTSARVLRQRAAPSGVFRCDRCDRVLPDSMAVEQDGYSFCRPLCADATSVSEITMQLAEQKATVDSWEPNADPPRSAFDGAVSITSTPTWPVRLRNDGALFELLVFGGVGFTSDIAISYSSAGIIDDSAPVITSTEITLQLAASGIAAGYYDITIAGTTYRRVLQITD